MAPTIDNPETERLVEELARKTGHTPAYVVAEAVRAAVGQPRRQQSLDEERKAAARAKIREIQKRVAALPALDTRTADEIIGYDEHGIPR